MIVNDRLKTKNETNNRDVPNEYNEKTKQILDNSINGKTKYSKPFNSVKDMVKEMLSDE